MTISGKTIQGGTRLIFDAVHGVSNIVEHMHSTIARGTLPWSAPSATPGRAPGLITPAVYSTIRGTNGILREGADIALGLIPEDSHISANSGPQLRATAAINGAFGDHLETTSNALAIPMGFHADGKPLELTTAALTTSFSDASPHLVILAHGLCLSELCWNRKGETSVGSRLQKELDCTPLYLRYNTGRHISTNGQEFSQLLERLCEEWPVPVESVSIIGHSMGGLITRSACWYADKQQHAWLGKLRRVVFMGTPHHGSVVAKAGQALDSVLQKLPHLSPFAISKHRSAGIKDLTHGDLLDEDWQDCHPHQPRRDNRRAVPLMPEVDYYFVAATVGRNLDDPLGHALGDMLVRLDSAVGSHKKQHKTLAVNLENCKVFHEKNHFDLLNDERVHHQVIDWFQSSATENVKRLA